ncbi:MAG: cytidylate kinase-like family protein [Lachnospiraceae bacterium]|nr:cytidylate kinase-like family protein [Lachnospiraceae bacterium]
MIICIGKSCGSGAHEIGEKLAGKLGYSFYDQKAVEKAACQKICEIDADQKDVLYAQLNEDAFGAIGETYDIGRTQFLAKNDVILKAASEGNCVLDVNCADYILKEAGINRVSVFITAPFEDRVKRMKEELQKDEIQASAFIKKENLRREHYYNYITGGSWGKAENYDICLNSSACGIEKTVDILQKLVDNFE